MASSVYLFQTNDHFRQLRGIPTNSGIKLRLKVSSILQPAKVTYAIGKTPRRSSRKPEYYNHTPLEVLRTRDIMRVTHLLPLTSCCCIQLPLLLANWPHWLEKKTNKQTKVFNSSTISNRPISWLNVTSIARIEDITRVCFYQDNQQ